MFKIFFFGFLALFGSVSIFSCGNQQVSEQGTNLREKELELASLYEKTADLKANHSDSIDYYSHLFSSKMQELISDESTLNYPFKQLKEALSPLRNILMTHSTRIVVMLSIEHIFGAKED